MLYAVLTLKGDVQHLHQKSFGAALIYGPFRYTRRRAAIHYGFGVYHYHIVSFGFV